MKGLISEEQLVSYEEWELKNASTMWKQFKREFNDKDFDRYRGYIIDIDERIQTTKQIVSDRFIKEKVINKKAVSRIQLIQDLIVKRTGKRYFVTPPINKTNEPKQIQTSPIKSSITIEKPKQISVERNNPKSLTNGTKNTEELKIL
jgi:hypothetical protein